MSPNITLAGGASRLTEAALCAWIGQAAPGDTIEYHRGALSFDVAATFSPLTEPQRKELGRVARRAWWAAEQNLVHLAQRRIGEDTCSYLAIARPRKPGTPYPLADLLPNESA